MRYISLLIGLLFFVSFSSYAQQSDIPYESGQLLVKLKSERAILAFQEDWKQNMSDVSIVAFEELSTSMHIFLLIIDEANHDFLLEILVKVKTFESVEVAQLNHLGDFRSTTPNDPLLSSQWHHENLGGGQSVFGADIRSKMAWSIATGGVTPRGDTIVVAVIDRGFDLNHSDLVDNIWTNKGEIPDNGIDDDGNGYVDDYYGWNATAGTSVITGGGSHGTQVNGMVGARGNNEVGVAGINWNVKIMQVSLSQIRESDVIKAYEYVLQQRKRYNETNGEQGAFVVATNSSWGIDRGKPEDAPLWCAFYDSLGQQGILSVGATANANLNVDVVGDLPTACSSPYFISVTSTTRRDIKSVAGFGRNTIDLGAPGENVFTTNTNDRYNSTSGTSFASPLVAGSIALLYSASCLHISDIARVSPSEAALLIRSYIVNGVDRILALANNTKSGGRLNVYNSILKLVQECASCPSLSPPSLIRDNEDNLIIGWEQNDIFLSYGILFRPLGSSEWDTLFVDSSPATLSNLASCQEYEIAVIGFCDEDQTSFPSESTFMTTDGCCVAPRDISTIFVQPNAARIRWRPTLPASSYILEYVNTATGQSVITSVLGEQILLRRLDFCTEYQVRMASICDLDTTDFSEVFRFKTIGCGACIETVYCEPGPGNSSTLFMERIIIGQDTITPVRNETGYIDMTDTIKINLEVGESYPLRIQLDSTNRALVNARAWIDYNHNGFFSPESETPITVNLFEGTVISRVLLIPQNARQGTTRVRVMVSDADIDPEAPAICPQDGFFGEYVDFCITLLPRTCPEAFDLDTVLVGFTLAELDWSPIEASISYLYRHKRSIDTEYSKKETTSETSYVLTDLEPCTSYDFEVRTICLFDTSAYQRITFTTICPTSTEVVQDLGIQMKVMPNPFQSLLQTQITIDRPTKASLVVTDITGRQILFQDLSFLNAGEQTIAIPSAVNWAPGVYILEIVTEQGRINQKVIKQ
jgi:serine protease